MLAFLINVFGLLSVSQAFMMDESNICISDDTSLICRCKDRGNFTITANMNFEIRWIVVEGCGVVNVPLGAMSHLKIQELVLKDINELNIRPFALVGVQALHTLRIEDIKNFNVSSHGFVGVLNVANVILKNVSAKELSVGCFGGVSTIENFRIENSYFGEIEESAFILTNITTFSVINCTIGIMDSNAFLIHVGKEVIFRNCNIQATNNYSICLSYVDSLSFLHCRIGALASTSIYTKSLLSLQFEECTVAEMDDYALALVDASQKITFIRNIIMLINEYSLFYVVENATSKNVDIYTCCNSFTCDCSIYWMWEFQGESFYDFLLSDSYCIGEGTNVSSMVPILDSHNNCMILENKKYVNNSKSSIVSSEVRSMSVTIFDPEFMFLCAIMLLFQIEFMYIL